MPTAIEFPVSAGRTTPGRPVGPERGPTPVEVQYAVIETGGEAAAIVERDAETEEEESR
ncbi:MULTISPECIES: hypothetical protein [Halorussus]|uniref:hypothetical protein n=1 Tax=Halorussus TaxID=1070314 RepID=UPI00209D2717|nr:hypothetical protein [Halorussus vallis]USZ76076.1 hypothetical protein NGM07_01835 [Halorussus vallis]